MLHSQAMQTIPTLHQPLHSKVSNYLNNQRRTGQFCDLLLELDSDDTLSLSVHFCVLAAQSQLINTNQKQQQFSIHNPLKITIRDFSCSQCLHTIVDFFYEDIMSVSKEHEPHFRQLAQILAVTELLNLYQLQPLGEVKETSEDATPGEGEPNPEPATKAEDVFENRQSYFKVGVIYSILFYMCHYHLCLVVKEPEGRKIQQQGELLYWL